MNTATTTTISGPYTQDNLDVFLVHSAALTNGDGDYVTLEEALDQKKIVVHETGNVGELFVENLYADHDIYIQAGEIVRGGRQDRVLSVDFILPAGQRFPIPSFCVESARWHRRGAEDIRTFSSSKHYLISKRQKLSAKLRASQSEVWKAVAEDQASLSRVVGESVQSHESASSLELSLEHEKLSRKRSELVAALKDLPRRHPDAVGFVFAINGEINSAEVYAHPRLFRKLWGKLLESAAVETIAECRPTRKASPDASAVREFLRETEHAQCDERPVTDRVVVRTRYHKTSVLLETADTKSKHNWIHRNYIRE